MKKIITVSFIVFLSFGAFCQSVRPFCFETPYLLPNYSYFDWEKDWKPYSISAQDGSTTYYRSPNGNFTDVWELNYFNSVGTPVATQLRLPFLTDDQLNLSSIYISGNNHHEAMKEADFGRAKGWELITYNFGYRVSQSTGANLPIDNPYIVLYNKYTGIIRAFVLVTQLFSEITYAGDINRAVTLSLSYDPTDNADFLPSVLAAHEAPVKPVDMLLGTYENNIQTTVKMTVPNQGISAIPKWYYADFPLMYDPCVCFHPSNLIIQLKINFSEDINWVYSGTSSSDKPFSTGGAVNKAKEMDLFNSFKEEVQSVNEDVKGFAKVTKSIGAAFSELEKSLDTGFPNGTYFSSFRQDFSLGKSITDFSKNIAWIPAIGSAVTSVISLVDFFIGKDKKETGKQEATAVMIKNTKATGTISSTADKRAIPFRIPGYTGPRVPGLSFEPIYDNPVGTVTLLRTPKVEIKTIKKLFYGRTPTLADGLAGNNVDAIYKCLHQIQLTEPLRLVFNSKVVDPNKVKLKACIIV